MEDTRVILEFRRLLLQSSCKFRLVLCIVALRLRMQMIRPAKHHLKCMSILLFQFFFKCVFVFWRRKKIPLSSRRAGVSGSSSEVPSVDTTSRNSKALPIPPPKKPSVSTPNASEEWSRKEEKKKKKEQKRRKEKKKRRRKKTRKAIKKNFVSFSGFLFWKHDKRVQCYVELFPRKVYSVSQQLIYTSLVLFDSQTRQDLFFFQEKKHKMESQKK